MILCKSYAKSLSLSVVFRGNILSLKDDECLEMRGNPHFQILVVPAEEGIQDTINVIPAEAGNQIYLNKNHSYV